MEALSMALIMGVGIGLHCMYHYDTGSVFVTALCGTLFALPIAVALRIAVAVVFYSYTTFALFALWWIVFNLLNLLLEAGSGAPVDALCINAAIAAVLVWIIFTLACGGIEIAMAMGRPLSSFVLRLVRSLPM